MTTLLAHLVRRFAAQPEDLASEALAVLLNQSAEAASVISDLFGRFDLPRPGALAYHCQVSGADLARPDVIGQDELGVEHLILEAKFWAGLTDNQPVAYLDRVTPGTGLLLFVCPAERMALLWAELVDRCRDAGMDVAVDRPAEPYAAIVADGRRIGLVSWRYLLRRVRSEVIGHGDPLALANVEQLIGLTQEMDSRAFKPLKSEELWRITPSRLSQLNDLIDSVTNELLARGVVNVQGVHSAALKGVYGRYMRTTGIGVFLKVDIGRWASSEGRPIWLAIHGDGDTWSTAAARQFMPALDRFRVDGRLFDDPRRVPEVALKVPLEVEEPAVIASLADQVSEIIEVASVRGDADLSGQLKGTIPARDSE